MFILKLRKIVVKKGTKIHFSLFQRFVFFLSLGDRNFLVQSKHGMLNANPSKSMETGKTI